MTKQKLSISQNFKTFLGAVVFIAFGALIIILISQKNKLNTAITKLAYEQSAANLDSNFKEELKSKYDYSRTGEPYQITFLEFGSKGCSACRKMENVLKQVIEKYPTKVNVEFIHVLTDTGRVLSKDFGVMVIPCQVLLDRNGNEFFRHTGYFSLDELENEFTKGGLK